MGSNTVEKILPEFSFWRIIVVLLSLGIDNSQDMYVAEAINIISMKSPDVYYERLIVPNFSNEFNTFEIDKQKIAKMQQTTTEYLSSPLIQERLDTLVDKIFAWWCSFASTS